MARLPTGMVSFLFTDIEGSTQLFRRLGDDYPAVLAEHNRLLRDVWSEYDGREVKTEGDSFFVAFESAAACMQAAVAAQAALGAHVWPTAEPRVRIGMHSGLAAPIDNDYVALAVHQAARVVGAANGGQTLATEETVSEASDDVAVAARSLGRFRLRSFDEPVRLFEVSAHEQPSDFAPIRAIPADGHNITRPLTSFLGRDREVGRLCELLEEARLVTVVGTGGVGKTRLASEVGTGLTARFEGGVWFADLSATEPRTSVDSAVAEAAGAQPGGRDAVEALLSHFGAESVLLIIDNCEHVMESVSGLASELLGRSPELKILATSRVPLGLDYEIVFHLDPLAIGQDRGGAEQLFLERLGSNQPNGDVSDVVREICRRLDGIPLALELAAARGRTSSPEDVLAMLEEHSRILGVRRPGADPRQESLTAVVEWSYGLLEPLDQQVFLRLAIFAASFSQDTGCLAAAHDSIERIDVAEAIWSLADHSLLERVGTANETRYRMLETIRAYALERTEPAERVETAQRLAQSLLDRVGPWMPTTGGWMNEMRVEVDNLRGLIPSLRDVEPETAQLLALSIVNLADQEADYVSGKQEADQFVANLRAVTVARPLLLAQAAGLHHRLGDFDTQELLEEAQQLSDEVGSEPDWASGWIGRQRAGRLAETGHTEAAIAMATEALQEQLPDEGRMRWLQELGVTLMPDDPTMAVEYLEQGLSITHKDRPLFLAGFHSNIAEGLMRLGEHTQAARHQLEALRGGVQLGMPILVAMSLMVAARLLALESSWEGAVHLHAAADRVIDQSGMTLYPDDVELTEKMLREAQDHLGEAYQRIRSHGYGLPIDEAATEGISALEELATSASH